MSSPWERMKKKMTQKEKVEALLNLVVENPELKIVAMVDSDVVADSGYSWWTGSFGTASIEEVVTKDDRLYIRSEDGEELIDDLCTAITVGYSDLTATEVEEKAKNAVDNYKWEKVIAVRINLPT